MVAFLVKLLEEATWPDLGRVVGGPSTASGPRQGTRTGV